MRNLDLALRTPGQVMLLERGHAQALLDRDLMDRPSRPSSRGLLARTMTAVGRLMKPVAMDDDDDDAPPRLAMPQISWAGTVEYAEGYAIVDGIAVIDIEGLLTPDGYIDWWNWCYCPGYAQIGAAIAAARADERVEAIFLREDSPGGYVDGCFDLADDIRAGNKANGGKPIWAFARMACSAAYALAAACDRIVATAEADVGSIGVLVMHYDISGFYAEYGIKIEAIQSGARKTDGADWKPLSEDARAHLQGVVDQIARRFGATVTAGRGISADDIAALQARWFLAQHDDPAQSGLALKLVDAIAAERAAFMALKQSLTSSTGGAKAGSGSQSASDANRTATTETDMSLTEQVAALRDKAAKGDAAALAELKALGLAPKADAAPADDDEDEQDDDAPDKKDGEDDDEEDDDKEPEAKATGTKAGFAILGHKEARGRTDLATKLGKKVSSGKMTYGEAVGMLAAAPKGNRLADAMAGRDRNPGTDGGSDGASKANAGLAAAVDRMNAKKAARRA